MGILFVAINANNNINNKIAIEIKINCHINFSLVKINRNIKYKREAMKATPIPSAIDIGVEKAEAIRLHIIANKREPQKTKRTVQNARFAIITSSYNIVLFFL